MKERMNGLGRLDFIIFLLMSGLRIKYERPFSDCGLNGNVSRLFFLNWCVGLSSPYGFKAYLSIRLITLTFCQV